MKRVKIIKLDLTLPSELYELEEKLKTIKGWGSFIIGGGSISNAYMGKKIRDIDVFCSFDLNQAKIKEVFGEVKEVKAFHGYDQEIPYLIKVHYKGYDVELIRTYSQKPFEFDLRFRQFYLKDGTVYANEKALEDIKNKEIVVINPATPMQTLFRVERFKEQFGFSVSKKSMDYLLWGFNQKEVKVEWAYEFIKRQKEKTSTELINNVRKWIDTHAVKNKDGEKIIQIKGATFPFNPVIEKLIKDAVLSVEDKSIAFNYEVIESFKEDKRKSYSLSLPYTKYDEKAKGFFEKIKSMRVRYVLSEQQAKAPLPVIKEKEFPKRFREYLEPNFMKSFLAFLKERREKMEVSIDYLWKTIKPLSENPTVELKWNEKGSLSDTLTQNELIMVIDETLLFKLRRCDNGKYTISGFLNNDPDGCGYYISMLGKALKEQHGEWFDFENENLKAHYRYDYSPQVYDFYFNGFRLPYDIFEERKTDFLIPITLSS